MRGLFGALAGAERKEVGSSRYGLVDEMWSNFFGGYAASKSGISVNAKSSLSNTTVLACCRVRADGHATVPWKLYQRTETTKNGRTVVGRREARDHPLYDLLATAPNEWMTSLEFRETQSFHVDLVGRSYAYKNIVRGEIAEMILLDPGRVTKRVNRDHSRVYKLHGLDGSTETVTGDQIWEVKGPSWDTIDGLDIVRLAAEAVGLALATEESHAAFHRNGVRPSGMLSVEGTVNEAGMIRLAAWVRRNFGGANNTGRMMVVDRNAKFLPMQMSGVDSQHIETRKFQVERICEVLRVMPIMIGFSGDKNATFASAEQMFLAHLVHCVRPIHRRFGGSADLHLLTKEQRQKGFYTGFVDSDFLSPSAEAKAKYNQTALGGPNNPGWVTQNDVRGWDEMDAVEGGDTLYVPAGMAALDENGKLVPIAAPAKSRTLRRLIMDRFTSDLCEVKFAAGAQDGTFSGYGSIFGNVDSHGDVIEKGAFKESLRTWEAKGKLPPMLLQHGGFFGPVDDALPIGKWTSMEENSRGLKVEGQLFALGTDRGQLIYEGMKAGSLDGLSIGYRAKKFTVGTKPSDPYRTLHEIDLVELSVVTFPSNDKATVGAVKSADIDSLHTLSDFEDFLREAGGPRWTKNTARDFVGRLTKIARREAGGDLDIAGLLEGLRSTRKLITPNHT